MFRSRCPARTTASIQSLGHSVREKSSSTVQNSIPASYWRGGTSRGVLFERQHLPQKKQWPRIFQRVMGSPDPNGRQLDGLGGGVSSLSKICVLSPPTHKDADIDYTFFSVGITTDEVDESANCGNMTSCIGPYAYEHGLVAKSDLGNTAVVHIHNTNTNKVIRAKFPVTKTEAVVEGDFTIDGVAGTGARIQLDFLNPAGAKTGRLLPTGNAVDVICDVQVSCVDAANPCVFVFADEVGLDGTILPDELSKHPTALPHLEKIRQHAAVAMGMCDAPDKCPQAVPKVGIMSRPIDHRILSGKTLQAGDVDVVARFLSDRLPHRAIPLTAALCTGAAAQIQGSVVQQCLSNPAKSNVLRIGHVSGRIEVGADRDSNGNIECATSYRTARKIMEGQVFYRQ